RKGKGLRLVDFAFGNLFTVDQDCAGPTFAEATVISKLVANGDFAFWQRLGRCNLRSAQTKIVVRVHRLAVFDVQAPTAEATCLRQNHSISTALGNLHSCGDRM